MRLAQYGSDFVISLRNFLIFIIQHLIGFPTFLAKQIKLCNWVFFSKRENNFDGTYGEIILIYIAKTFSFENEASDVSKIPEGIVQ